MSIFQDKEAVMQSSGSYKANLSGELQYESFLPKPLSQVLEIDTESFNGLLIEANAKLAILDTMSKRIPNLHLFIGMYVRKESLLSSQIEGTQATLEDIFDPGIEGNANVDVSEVINYIKATEYALQRLKTLPLCNRLIKETHKILMQGVRGQEKTPGEFRISQNWIGAQGFGIKNASYVPPNVEDMSNAMQDFENFLNTEDEKNILICTALIHYQFETIHPFLDGNGRIGRLLITLFLISKGYLSYPALYISWFLKINRIEYFDRMTEVRKKGNYEQWIAFFLKGIVVSCDDAIETIDKLLELREKNTAKIEHLKRAGITAMELFSYIEKNPIIDITKTAKELGVTFNTASAAVNRLVGLDILHPSSTDKRNRTYIYKEYLDALRNGTE